MKAQRLYTVLLCSLLFSALSCIKEEPGITDEDGLVRVPVNLNLSVHAVIDGTPDTKSIIEPEIVPSLTDAAQIKNIVVLQFNGITSEARLVGGQTYFDHWPLTGDEQLTLVASATANTVVVLANTFDRISITSNTTLGQFLEQDYTTIGGLSGVLTRSGDDDYFRLSGSKKLNSVEGQTTVDIALKRNVAKIVVNVTNNTSGDNLVTISKVQLREINAKYYYLAHIGAGISVDFSDPYSEVYPLRFDNSQEDFTGTTQTYTYYVPANLRGTTDNEYQYSKGLGAPKGATRFCIYGTYGTSNTPINYTYFLGGNLTNDFNIQPNYKYIYNITINSKGNPNYDYRIEDLGEIKFQTDANCYMLHPPVIEGQSRIYAIPVRRAAVFWNVSGSNSGVYGANSFIENDHYENNRLLSDSQWQAEVLWSDFDLSGYTGDDSFLVSGFSSGRGFDPTSQEANTQPYFKVKIKNGMNGNVVVGIKKQGGNAILWSWHLWITDYDPDKYVVPEGGKYIYGVDNGYIHRYKSGTPVTPGIWETDATQSKVGYANGFIMDRNLGALGSNETGYRAYGLFYQWGRKDPFAVIDANGNGNRFYLNGTPPSVYVLSSSGTTPEHRSLRNDNETYLSSDSYKNIRFSVTNPMVYIYSVGSNDWTSADDDLGAGTNTSYNWNDRKFWEHTGDQAILELKKSIYDPCPQGWKVPSGGIFNGFNRMTESTAESGTYTTVWNGSGQYYYPEGYVNAETTGSIYFWAFGQRASESGAHRLSGSMGFFWSQNPIVSKGIGLGNMSDYLSDHTSVGYSSSRSTATPIRCIRE